MPKPLTPDQRARLRDWLERGEGDVFRLPVRTSPPQAWELAAEFDPRDCATFAYREFTRRRVAYPSEGGWAYVAQEDGETVLVGGLRFGKPF